MIIEKCLAVSQHSWAPLIACVLKRERRCLEGVQLIVNRLSSTRDETAQRAVPVSSEEWEGTFSPGITVYPGSFTLLPGAAVILIV